MRVFRTQATWELRAAGSGDVDLSSLIENVLSRVAPLRDSLTALRAAFEEDFYCKLEILQHIGDDPVGPGLRNRARAHRSTCRARCSARRGSVLRRVTFPHSGPGEPAWPVTMRP